MNPQEFLKEFGSVANAPGGVQRLREMILQLAVMGKLVEQNPEDEPASILIERIVAEKIRLIKDKKIKKTKKLPKISENEHPFKLPNGWGFIRLGEISNRIGSGSTPRGGKRSYIEKGIPFLRSQNIWNDRLKIDDVVYISPEIHEKMANTKVQAKDILLNITGASLGRSTLIPDDFGEANVSQHVSIIRTTNSKNRKFLHACIISPYFQKMVWNRQVGMAREGLSKKVLEQFEIPLPPLREQKRIVAKVDQLMTLCDRLEAQQQRRSKLIKSTRISALEALADASGGDELKTAWERVEKNLPMLFEAPEDVEDLKRCILQNAVMGKLVSGGKQVLRQLKDVISFGPKNGLSPRGVDFETRTKVLTLSATTKGSIDLSKFKYIVLGRKFEFLDSAVLMAIITA